MSRRLVMVGGLLLAGLVAGLAAARPAVADGRLCLAEIARQEQEHGLPAGLLGAIAVVESGRATADGSRQPWPWTLNVDGRGGYFASREEAALALEEHVRRGASVDVGCMQVNLAHHPKAFAAPHQALDPRDNVAYAARFLRALYRETGSWSDAAAYYHSRTPALAEAYARRVAVVLGGQPGAGSAPPSVPPAGAEYRPRMIAAGRATTPADAAGLLADLRESRRILLLSQQQRREARVHQGLRGR